MKYEVTYEFYTGKKTTTQTAYCLDQDSVWRLINTLSRMGYTLKEVKEGK